ncbi:CBS domain-containing protein [Halodesulfurarchaeum sp.]|uniref:CBS domain-containing protein n=1 Tax=Halodesulfurarchaeum sp. TaxID=1980530 RepID=UPI001BBC8666|nr:CBS domain-containing protein [Halodesulfurarchaeum sp.]
MSLAELMSTKLITVPLGVTLDAAVNEMLGNRVGSVLVVDGEEPVGIITETDILAAGSGTERPFGDIPVSRAMSPNLVTIDPDATAESAIERMQEYGIKKLVVTEDGTLTGIVTTTDLVVHRTDLAEEVTAIDRQQSYPET